MSTQEKLAYLPYQKKMDCANKPDRVWVVPAEPVLPLDLQHGINAFLEDEVHDWKWADGWLRYFGRGHDQACWLILEYEDAEAEENQADG